MFAKENEPTVNDQGELKYLWVPHNLNVKK